MTSSGRQIPPLVDLTALVEQAAEAIGVDDADGNVVYANAAFRELFGIDHGAELGCLDDYIAPQSRHELLERHSRRMRGGNEAERFEFVGLRRDGATLWLEATVVPYRHEGRVVGTSAVFRDVTDRHQRDAWLRRTQREYRDLFDSAFDAMIVFEPEQERVLDVNRRACELYGFSRDEFVGMSLKSVTRDIDRGRHTIASIIETRSVANFETVHRRKDGSEITVECNASLVSYGDQPAIVTINRDVTEQRRLQRQVRHAEKMRAIGQLAAGIAHEFNNVLASILATAESLRDDTEDEATAARIQSMIDRAEAGGRVTRELLTLSHVPTAPAVPVSLGARVQTMASSIERLLGDAIELRVAISPEPDLVVAEPSELEQILLNLVINARDAMPRGGQLRIETTPITLERGLATTTKTLPSGRYVALTVADTGDGIDHNAMPRLFEPFFTTKAAGKGTGLGLATVYSIVDKLEGSIDVTGGDGACFVVYLPARRSGSSDSDSRRADRPRGGSETLLVVDDEPTILKGLAEGLTKLGYHVLTANSQASAKQVLARHDGSIDLLLTDLSMPGGDGSELARELLAHDPQLQVVVMSGYAGSDLGEGLPGASFLQKPFSRAALARTVRRALDRRRLARRSL